MQLYRKALRDFDRLLKKAQATSLNEPTAVTLATANAAGRPSARVVLLKSFDENGFVFFSNRESRKGHDLAANPVAALCFYWDPLRRQALIEGSVLPISEEESDAYWLTRPRKSQIGAWASLQSRPMETRGKLLARVVSFSARFAGKKIPRPNYWGGYRLVPVRIEFWSKKAFRLHERKVYQKEQGQWTCQLLYP